MDIFLWVQTLYGEAHLVGGGSVACAKRPLANIVVCRMATLRDVPLMNAQLNLPLARRKRGEGITKVSNNNKEWLLDVRHVARDICCTKGWVCADDLRQWADLYRRYPSHPNCWGAVFSGKQFIPGEYIVSKQPQGHCNRIRVHRLRNP